ncbi:CDP-glycerol glycerophosphotransferase family protein [Leucobacter aridicollis]|uniref:CDP-glycerol glycerophosphotransferase (TagB/SpsB family) n=1 Tax=Leucobacter aridicollis TaxID=283878 RepID=A0A852R976_9MICO|nr:CDP-glycerol glycerophosphotransferase family protein [Leucobacter aridicollis]NYD25450.1 CDP-glycerol glycerophosphotransferase (TagB/SpsB family) [Leucobacter aridicollis]
MDRETGANDNAEHLYRYAMQHCEDVELWFVLSPQSSDWERLKNEGFRLVAPRSDEHRVLLENTDLIASSHADHTVISQWGSKYYRERRWRFVFLQHGVTKDDLSRWLNGKFIDLMVTSSTAEYESIVGDDTGYDLTGREVVLTGFPRHDRLMRLGNGRPDKTILLIAPTWRREVIIPLREGTGALGETSYWQHWDQLLRSEAVRLYLESDEFEVVFLPHPDVAPFISSIAEYEQLGIRVASYEEDVQELLANTVLGLTDYSSLVFDLAVLGTPTLYFQFDRDQFFNGNHVYDPGYFDYERDGFGPVAVGLLEAEHALASFYRGDTSLMKAGTERALASTPWRDGMNCSRTVAAIREALAVSPVRLINTSHPSLEIESRGLYEIDSGGSGSKALDAAAQVEG